MKNKSRKRASRISDAELLVAKLTTNNVAELKNVVREKLSEGVCIADVLGDYHHCHYPADKVFCCVCGSRQHKDGLHVVRSDGKEATVGYCCATRKLGERFVQAHKRNKGERDRQDYLRIIHAFQPTALRIRHAQMTRPWMELAESVRAARYALRIALGTTAFEIITQAAIDGAALTVPERVLVSEWAQTDGTWGGNDGSDNDGSEEPKDRYKWVQNNAGYVSGGALFRKGDPADIIKDLERILQNFATMAANTESYSTGQLRTLVKMLRGGGQGLENLLQMKRAADEFFAPDYASFIANWVNCNRNKHGHNFAHSINARDGIFVNETMARNAAKPRFVEPAQDLIGALAALR